MEKLKQNTLDESTTDLGFCRVLNENAGKTVASLTRTVTLDDGSEVLVEGMTSDAIKNLLKGSTDKTPGEPVEVYQDSSIIGPTETQILDGVVQMYNNEELNTVSVLNMDDLTSEDSNLTDDNDNLTDDNDNLTFENNGMEG